MRSGSPESTAGPVPRQRASPLDTSPVFSASPPAGDAAYAASVELARERGAFPLFNADMYLSGGNFASRLPQEIKDKIRKHGIALES